MITWNSRIAAGAVAMSVAAGTALALPGASGTPRLTGASRSTAAPTSATVAGIDAFAADLYRGGTSRRNVVFSPYSIETAFSMLRAGATGQTATDLDAVLHFTASGRDAAFRNITNHVVTQNTPPPASTSNDGYGAPIVTLANALWVQEAQAIRAAFTQRLSTYYGAALKRVDFAGSSAAQTINDWVSTRTAGLIKKLFDSLDPSTKLVLADALYLKAGWEHTFNDPQKGTFTTPSGPKKAPLMSETERMVWAQGDGWRAALVPYLGGHLGMWVVVPTKGTAPGKVLTAATLKALAAAKTVESVRLTMPTWKTTTTIELLPVLARLGLKHLSGLGGIGPGLSVTDAIHKATITVTKDGTEAAAVTGIVVGTAAEVLNDVHVLRADHPFAYAIVDRQTGTPLFLGSVSDPTAR